MKKILLLSIFSLLIIGVFSACSDQTSCDFCTAEEGCGWCAPIQQCLNGTFNGPSNNLTCIGSAWEFQKCTPCNQFADCRTCIERDSDCNWCPSVNNGQGGCRDIGFTCTGTKFCPCDVFESCSECISDSQCQWCSESMSCQASNHTCQGNQPSFNWTTSCPCAGNRDCVNCLATYGCEWCGSGECSMGCTTNPYTNCGAYCTDNADTCDSCTTLEGCAWCSLTNQCVDAATSPCPYSFTCPVCAAASYCDTCAIIPDCVWCSDSKSCRPKGTQCFTAHSCEAYCETYPTCNECIDARGCGWCDNSGLCEDIGNTTCFTAHTCTNPTPLPPVAPPKCHFDGGAFVGGMFFVIGLAVLAGGGYYFYRWKTGRKIDYRELR